MTLSVVEALRWFTFILLPVYFTFDLFDRKQVKDEREELIHLRTMELVHKMTVVIATLLALIYFFWWRDMNAIVPLSLFALATMGVEMVGKLFYRWKL